MRPVRRRNSPNKETLIYIPISHVTVIRVYTTRIAKPHDELLINTLLLLLLLILPIYLGMCPSIPIHIHPYMSKLRLLLKLMMKSMYYVYSGSRTYPDHDSGCSDADPKPAARQTRGGSYIMSIQEYNRR